MRYGAGKLMYELVAGWGKIPAGWDLVEVPSIAVDAEDRVYVMNRGEHPVIVLDRLGNFLGSWGEGVFARPHSIFIGRDGFAYCVDDGDHTVRKLTLDGQLVMTIGTPGQPSDTGYVPGQFYSVQRPGPPFHRPTNAALSPEGDIYVSDGYGNCRVHKFSPEGKLLFSWGEPGNGPGQFRLVHGICVDRHGTVYVGDRIHCRVQVFSPDGRFITQWTDVYQPNDLHIDGEDRLFIAEVGTVFGNGKPPEYLSVPAEVPPRVTVRRLDGTVLSTITGPDPRVRPRDPSAILCPHGARTDSHGDLYVGSNIAQRARNQRLNGRDFQALHKFRSVCD